MVQLALDDSNKLRCMTWSGQKSDGVLSDAYTECVRDQGDAITFLSDTRHTSFYAVVQSHYNFFT